MYHDFIFSIEATFPVFLVMVIGYFLHKFGFMTEEFCKASDKLVFKVTLPIMLMKGLVEVDLVHDFDGKYVLFCAVVTIVGILTIWGLTKTFMKDKSSIAEFVQASYRSSAAILGSTFILNIYGTTCMTSLMIIGSVPLFNIFAVLLLTLETGEEEHKTKEEQREYLKKKLKGAMLGILKNPIIDGIVLGIVLSLLPIKYPVILTKTCANIAGLTSPLALLSIGATFQGKKAIAKIKPTILASFIKLVVLVAVFLPIATALGFRDEKLVALIIMLGSPTTATSYIMSKNMGHEGVLSSSCIAVTTLFSSITITLWIFIFRSLGYL